MSLPFDAQLLDLFTLPICLRLRSFVIMASQDYISQFSQGIPPTQPHRSPSRTPRRDPSSMTHENWVPAFRGPLHMATTHYRSPNFGYTHTWTPPRLPLTPSSTSPTPSHWPHMQHQGYPTQPLFPPMPPAPSPPPPPLQRIHDTSTIHYDVSQITLLHASTLHVTDPQRLPSPPMRDSSYATLETRRGLP